jgi:flagellar hook-associated protein 1
MGLNFSPIEIGRRALQANQLGLAVAGQNIANVNTPGYTRQTLQLSPAAVGGLSPSPIGSGVNIDSVRALRDQFLDARILTETGIAGRYTSERDTLTQVDLVFNDTNNPAGMSQAMQKFFNSFADLEAHPTSVPLRNIVVQQGVNLATTFNSTNSRLEEIRSNADSSLRVLVDEVNSLVADIDDLNRKIALGSSIGANVSELEDRRYLALTKVTELVGAKSFYDSEGKVNITMADGRALLAGDKITELTSVSVAPNGLAEIRMDGVAVTISDGKIKGIQNAIATTTTAIDDLDDFTASMVARVNTLHTSGDDLDGTDGVNFFTVPAGGVTAANISVSTAITADSRKVVASGNGSGSGDSSVARNIAALFTDPTSTSGSKSGSYSSIFASIVTDVADKVRTADDNILTQTAILTQVTAQRETFSGVSLDEEAIKLLQYQKAYEAAARFLQIADQMTQTILALGQ